MFDSGLGGLTVLRRLLSLRPGQPCIYLADTARVPYGGRSAAEIRVIAAEVTSYLKKQGSQALLMACNTSNAIALDVAEATAGGPVVGLIEAVAKVVRASRVGVLATPATAGSGAYGKAFRAANTQITVVEVGCPFFVPAIERHDLGSGALIEAAKNYLEPLLAAEVETIVLGCTHPAIAAVDVLCEILPAPLPLPHGADAFSGCRFLVTGDPEPFAAGLEHWLGASQKVEWVKLQQAG